MTIALNRCRCGRVPGFRSKQTAYLSVETWVQCPSRTCGASGDQVEDAFADQDTAGMLWNRDGGYKR